MIKMCGTQYVTAGKIEILLPGSHAVNSNLTHCYAKQAASGSESSLFCINSPEIWHYQVYFRSSR